MIPLVARFVRDEGMGMGSTERTQARAERRRSGAGAWAAVGAVIWVFVPPLPASAGVSEKIMSGVHEGVATCDGSQCHGAPGMGDGVVWGNEYSLWNGPDDQHSKAYARLREPQAVKMARNLGLKEPAHQAKLCLDCHTDNAPAERRGEVFNAEDGIGCEACHGGSERWLKSHDDGTPHAQNIKNGLYPTDDPVARAELCLSCHFGTSEKFVDHRLMGAGHPRQSFELQLFTQVQPAHFAVDDDYVERGKQAPSGVVYWAVGQAVAVRDLMSAIADPKLARDGRWPQLVFFDCHACHHPMSEGRWYPRASTGLPPGLPRLDDSSLLMLRHVYQAVAPDKANTFRKDLRALHRAMWRSDKEIAEVAGRVRQGAVAVLERLRTWRPDANAARSILKSIAKEGAGGEYLDYAGAEQATMAVQDLGNDLYVMGALKGGTLKTVVAESKVLLKTTQNPEKFDRQGARAAFKRLQAALP